MASGTARDTTTTGVTPVNVVSTSLKTDHARNTKMGA